MTGNSVKQELAETEGRIAHKLRDLTDVHVIEGQARRPPAYVRRHLFEHAQADGVLNDQMIPQHFLPYLDLAWPRETIGSYGNDGETSCGAGHDY